MYKLCLTWYLHKGATKDDQRLLPMKGKYPSQAELVLRGEEATLPSFTINSLIFYFMASKLISPCTFYSCLRAVRDAVGSAVGAALRLYEERAGELGLAVALRRGPRCPALAEALEGLHDVERHYRLLYLESSLLLQRISCDDLDTMEALPQAWECILERHKPHVVQGSARAGTSLFKGGLEHGLCERCPCSEQAALFTWCDK
uniref:Uncharacterized protein n=1 Tax=Nothoprocta perdicaria TaxID=30464 RepID=A0A8C6Z0E3_NOTPE